MYYTLGIVRRSDMTLQLHDVQRVAHKVALLVFERENGFLVTNGGSPKTKREKLVGSLEEALELVMAERHGRTPILEENC
jgi:hypothetical protein